MKKLLLLLLVIFMSVTSAFATNLPKSVTDYIKAQVPNATIRFDGLVMFPDKTTYLPLIPAVVDIVDKVNVVYTYPQKSKTLAQKPEIIVFDNNYVLLKVIKDKNGVTISKATDSLSISSSNFLILFATPSGPTSPSTLSAKSFASGTSVSVSTSKPLDLASLAISYR